MSKTILIANDEELLRKSLRKDLVILGYEVREAADGEQALEELANDHIDLLICDVLIPKRTGWELLKAVKSNPKTKNVPVIVLTAKECGTGHVQGVRAGRRLLYEQAFTKSQLLHGIRLLFEDHSDSFSTTAASN